MASPGQGKKHPYDQEDADGFIEELMKMILENKLHLSGHSDQKVIEFTQPKDLPDLLNLEITKDGTDKNEMLKLCKTFIKYAVKTGHPHFFNQLHSSADTYSYGGSILTDALNTNLHTYEVAPAFMVTELYMLKKISSLVGFKDYDGMFLPGGSIANMMAVHLARFRFDKEIKTKGFSGSQKLVLYCSEDAHYSLSKGASFMGLGSDNCVQVKVDRRGKMDPKDLEMKIKATKEQGNIPLLVLVTSGTTVLNAFDPIDSVADLCEEHNIWLHVDASIGGITLVSEKHRHLLDGVHRANSFHWNFHKLMRTVIQCSVFLVQHPTLFEECNGTNAAYLFQPDKHYDVSYDFGGKSIQCGRRSESFKLWVQWRARGDDGLAWTVDHAFDNAGYLTGRLQEHDGFRLVLPEFEGLTVSFWYIPPSLRGLEENEDWWTKVYQTTVTIKGRMLAEGTIMIGFQPLKSFGIGNFFRIVIINPDLTHKDMDFVLEEIERLAVDL